MKVLLVSCVLLACLLSAFAAPVIPVTALKGDSFDFIAYLEGDWEVTKTLSLSDGSVELRKGFYSFEKVSDSLVDGICHENTSETGFSTIDSEFLMRVEMEGPMFGKVDISFSEPGLLASEEAFVNLLSFQFEAIFDGVFVFRGAHNEEDVVSMITISEKEKFLWVVSHRDGTIETSEFVRFVPVSPRSFLQKYGFTIVMVVVMMGSRFFASKMQTQQQAQQVAQVQRAATEAAPVAVDGATGEGVAETAPAQTTGAATEGGDASASERVSKKDD
eukprot:TRINITY_DN685_c0_g7_i2.p1 TRINITY_DN685_c0_g7~~TRINITY_DN685_c0_g7_i2.p1  ORF type:complete len:317 (+),score=97.95 TRINITY_DN685_c0_g7_i2:129-953(+)